MLEDASNRELLAAWLGGNEAAAGLLVDRYLVRLTALARARLSRRLARRLDPEDVVLSAWRSFFVAVRERRARTPDNDDLWPLLVTITLRKLSHQAERHQAAQRSMNREETAFSDFVQHAAAHEPGPNEAAVLADEVEAVLSTLEGLSREVFVRRLQGWNTDRIAKDLGISDRTVRRAMESIRDVFSGSADATGTLRVPSAKRESTVAPADGTRSVPATFITRSVSEDSEPLARRDSRRPSARDASPPTAASELQNYSDYLLVKLLGQGAFGRVYRSLDRRTGETVAVKFLRKRFWHDPRATDLLLHEARILSRLTDPRTVGYRGFGRTGYGAVFLVLDWIEGEDLSAWALRTRPSPQECAAVVADVAGAVAAAHRLGVLHCDLKPANVLRRPDGRVVLTDFGFARSLAGSASDLSGGTPGFLAPEQVSDAFGTIGVRTDVHGLGALLYALLTGRPPSTGIDVPAVLAHVLTGQPGPVCGINPAVGADLEAIVTRCLEKQPADRFSDAATVSEVLGSVSGFSGRVRRRDETLGSADSTDKNC